MTRTLADMTPDERDDCVGRWCETSPARGLGILTRVDDGYLDATVFQVESEDAWRHGLAEVTPRYDLPRAWTPSGDPVPGEWDDDQGKNLMRRWVSTWEWKHDTPQHIIDQHKETP